MPVLVVLPLVILVPLAHPRLTRTPLCPQSLDPHYLVSSSSSSSPLTHPSCPQALDFYDKALDELEDEKLEGDLANDAVAGHSEAVLLCNRATVLLKLHEREAGGGDGGAGEDAPAPPPPSSAPPVVTTASIRKCEAAARAAVASDGGYFKAHYRLSQVSCVSRRPASTGRPRRRSPLFTHTHTSAGARAARQAPRGDSCGTGSARV